MNLITVLKTLASLQGLGVVASESLSGSQRGPPTGPEYSGEVARVTRIRDKGWHADPTPVGDLVGQGKTAQPTPKQEKQNGTPIIINGYNPSFSAGSVTAVYNVVRVPMLTASGQPSGRSTTRPKQARWLEIITLAQGVNGQFHFDETSALNPPGGIPALEEQK